MIASLEAAPLIDRYDEHGQSKVRNDGNNVRPLYVVKYFATLFSPHLSPFPPFGCQKKFLPYSIYFMPLSRCPFLLDFRITLYLLPPSPLPASFHFLSTLMMMMMKLR